MSSCLLFALFLSVACTMHGTQGSETTLTDEDFENIDSLAQIKTPENSQKKDTEGLFEGDMNLRHDIAAYKKKTGSKFESAAQRSPLKRWKDAQIPYTVDSSYTRAQRATIASAFSSAYDVRPQDFRSPFSQWSVAACDSRPMVTFNPRHIESKTCLRFIPRRSERDYLYIFPGSGCWSDVGRGGYGRQELSIKVPTPGSYGTCVSLGTIAHELLHAAGFFHEQSRADRDEYVTILEENVQEGKLNNFENYDLQRITHGGTKYDYHSLMHYGNKDFSKNGRPTIVPKDPSVTRLGREDGLSDTDALEVNRLYKCDEKASKTTPKPKPVPTPEPKPIKPVEPPTGTGNYVLQIVKPGIGKIVFECNADKSDASYCRRRSWQCNSIGARFRSIFGRRSLTEECSMSCSMRHACLTMARMGHCTSWFARRMQDGCGCACINQLSPETLHPDHRVKDPFGFSFDAR